MVSGKDADVETVAEIRSGRLVVIAMEPARVHRRWLCRCDCGREVWMAAWKPSRTPRSCLHCRRFDAPSTLYERFHAFWVPEPNTGCYLWTGTHRSDGYGQIGVARGAGTRAFHNEPAHRVAWYLHHGPIPDDLWVLHHCDTRLCVNWVDHLFLGDRRANVDDMTRKERASLRTRKLSRAQHEEIRALAATRPMPLSNNAIGKLYGVTGATIGNILNGRYRPV